MTEKIKVIIIVGPTGCGKTSLGVKLAKELNGEVISADSMQIYKDMHIASAAPDVSEMMGVPHHLVEFLPYGSSYTVYDWVKAARQQVEKTAKAGKTPIIVGGSGLYVNCFADNIQLSENETDPHLREKLSYEAETLGSEMLLERLKKIDPEAAKKLHGNDKKRIIRALEIYETTGKTPTEQNRLSRGVPSPYDVTIIGINFADRQKLYERINKRVDLMLKKGLVEEARVAYSKRSGKTDGAVQAIGHKEFFDVFENKCTLLEATEKLKRATRRYSKRQITWFGARNDINWIYADKEDVFSSAMEIIRIGGVKSEKQ